MSDLSRAVVGVVHVLSKRQAKEQVSSRFPVPAWLSNATPHSCSPTNRVVCSVARTLLRSTSMTHCDYGSSKLVSIRTALAFEIPHIYFAGVIVLSTQLLALGLRKMRQPKVIAEVIGGILLGWSSALLLSYSPHLLPQGPTAFGRIPGFTQHIFPEDSRPFLSLVANIGLCLFLFLVGLEIDAAVIRRNARLSVTVATAGMILPFGTITFPIYFRPISHCFSQASAQLLLYRCTTPSLTKMSSSQTSCSSPAWPTPSLHSPSSAVSSLS